MTTEKLKKQIEEIQRYFIDKIINADFEIIKVTEYTAHIKIDKQFLFFIWIANYAENIEITNGSSFDVSFMNLNFCLDEKKKIFRFFHPYRKNEEMIAVEREKAELKRLKEKYENR